MAVDALLSDVGANDSKVPLPAAPTPPPFLMWVGYGLLMIQTVLGLCAVGAIWWTVSSTIARMQSDTQQNTAAIVEIKRQADIDRAQNAAGFEKLSNKLELDNNAVTTKLGTISETMTRVDTQLGDLKAQGNGGRR